MNDACCFYLKKVPEVPVGGQIMPDIYSCDYKADKTEELLFISNPLVRIPC